MSTEGVVLRDLVDDDTHGNYLGAAKTQPFEPDDYIAVSDADKGPAQVTHVDEVDLGWNINPCNIPNPLIGGVDNDQLWKLIRRFNHQIFHIKQASKPYIGGLDLNVSGQEEFSPNKFRSQFERLYMGLIIGVLAFCKHIARLRSWNESRRTTAFCVIYFISWSLNRLIPALMILCTALLISPIVRNTLFPPAPLALVDHKTGGVAKPPAGTLGSTDTATGAPENRRGEALENEASNFVASIGAIAMNIMTGGDPHGEAETEGESLADAIPEPDAVATIVATAKDKAGGIDKPSGDKTKAPMEQKMWAQIRPLMHVLQVVSDTWERCAHVLTPVPPFSQPSSLFRVAGVLVPLIVASEFITANMIFRTTTFFIGLGIFGDPIITRGRILLERNYPDWKQILDVNNTIFKGVPTDAQLAITLLRLGEANKAPIPPPPSTSETPPEKPLDLEDDVLNASSGDRPLGASKAELEEAASHHAGAVDDAGGEDNEMTSTSSDSKKRSKYLGFVKGAVKGVVKFGIGVDRVRATSGAESAKQRVGVVPKKNGKPELALLRFEARHHGHQGSVLLDTESEIATVSFLADSKTTKERISMSSDRRSPALWTVPITEIFGLKKHSGYGFKSKLFAGWAMDRKMRDSLEITDSNDQTYVLTALPFRDELFNRLCAIGGQRWEVM